MPAAHEGAAQLVVALAEANRLQVEGDMDAAIGRLHEVVTMFPSRFSATEQRLHVRALHLLGRLYRRQGELHTAVQVLRRALDLCDAAASSGETAVPTIEHAAVRNELGVTFKYFGDFASAQQEYEQAEQLISRANADGHPLLADICHNLGGVAHARGDHAVAEEATRRALAIRGATVGEQHPDAVADRAALAAILISTGRLEEAEALLIGALRFYEATIGAVHHEVAVTLHNLAAIAAYRMRWDQAESLLRRSLSIKNVVLGASHPETATTLANLARVCAQRGDRPAATALYRQVQVALENRVAPDHFLLERVRNALLDLDADSGRRERPALVSPRREDAR